MYESNDKEENLKRPRYCEILSDEGLYGAILDHWLQVAIVIEEGYRQVFMKHSRKNSRKFSNIRMSCSK